MTLPSTGALAFANIGTEVFGSSTYSVELNWVQSHTKDSVANMNSLYSRAWYQRNVDGNCDNGNCTNNNCACGNIAAAFNCYITTSQCTHSPTNCTFIEYGSNCNCEGVTAAGVNCTNCDATNWLQGNCNCNSLGGYNCNYTAWSTACNCDCAPPPPPPACDCACACVCDCACAPPPACDCVCAPPPACDCVCDCNCTCFPAGCEVMLFDTTWKLIEELTVDDVLMGADGNPAYIKEIETPVLGNRRMLSFEEDSDMRWSDEHTFWAKDKDRQWLWTANHANWIKEVEVGAIGGLKDNNSFLPVEGVEFATLNGFEQRKVIDVTDKYDYGYNTKLYLPVTENGSMIIVKGYVVGASINEFKYDYTKLDWNQSQPIIKHKIEVK